jgi:protein SCO1/2
MRTGTDHRCSGARKAAAAFALVAGLLIAAQASARAPGQSFEGATVEGPATLPDFTLHDQDGRRLALRSERGRLVLLTFLYTDCKDVCPLTAENLNLALRQLGAAAKDVRVLAISVDPQGDTRKAVRHFISVHRLSPRFRYLIGTEQQLAPVWRDYNVVSVKRAKGDIDHTLYTLLVDRTGKGRVLFDSTARPAAIAHDARLLLR